MIYDNIISPNLMIVKCFFKKKLKKVAIFDDFFYNQVKGGCFMDIEYLKQVKKEKKMKLQEISDLSGIPKRTVDGIFSGKTKNPRIDTMQAIERALGLDDKSEKPILSEEEKELIALISELTDEETQELTSFVDYLISKRK